MAKKNAKRKAAKIFTVSNIIYACVILLALAAAVALAVMGRAKPIVIPDENGEDYALAVLTEREICEEEPKFSCRVFGVGIDENAGNANESAKIVAEAKTDFSGVAILQRTECETEKVTFTVNCERMAGNLRVVLIDENMRIVHDFPIGESSSFTVERAKGKSFELRVAGESAVFTVTSERMFE